MPRKKKDEVEQIVEKIIEAEFKETMEQSYIDYAIEVITERALPDIRDGLKPVQRKSIYTFEELGITKDKPFKKAGRVVGECMGKYHCHGDTSIYEAMVRMSQPFVNNLPLIDGHGNWGSIDGDGAAAMRYCVSGDTLINTQYGLIPIKDIVKSNLNTDNDINLIIKSKDKKNNTASKLFNSGEHKTFTIILKNGLEITCTENHPILILNSNLTLEWRLVKDLDGSEKCAIDLNTSNALFGNNHDILEARMLGAMISEGYITTQNRIGINNTDIDLIKPVEEYFKNKKNIEAKINKNSRGYYEFCFADKQLYNKFITEFNYKESAVNKEIPSQVLQGTKEYQKEFLRYLFEGDGSVLYNNTPYIDDDRIELSYSSKSKKLIMTLQIILATQFGILSKIHRNKKRNEYKLYIFGKYIQKFKKEIGFVSSRKNEILNSIPIKETAKNSLISYKEISSYIKEKDTKIKRNIYTLEALNKYKEYIDKEIIEYIFDIFDGYEYIQIKEIKENPKEVVYSLRVDSNCHSFTGNGFINHNTECRLEKISNELIDGLKDKIVPFVPNFDEEEIEPTVLPARFPNLLVNGTNGIAVGLISSIPTHNLRDCTNMLIHYMKKNSKKIVDVSTAELLDILKGPDFPTGGSIVNVEDLMEIYKTGEGNLFIRAKLEEETISGKPCLIVTEIPYTYSGKKASLIDKISKIILSKKIDELVEIRDESSKEGLRIVIECKKGSDLVKVANKLYKFTPLQDTMPVRFNGTIGKELIPFNLVDYCKYFTKFQEEIYTKEYENKKNRLLKKKEIYEGLVKSIDFIDVIIDLIRHAEKVEYAKRCLMTGNTNNIKFALKKNEQVAKKFDFTELQAEAILETTLRKLNNLEVEALTETLAETNKGIDTCTKILSTREELYKVIINRLSKIAKEYGIDRRTELKTATIVEYKEEPKIYETNIVFDKYGYIKAFDEKTISKVDEGVFENCKLNKKTDSQDSLWAFSDEGFMYQVKLATLPFNKQNDRGTLLEVKVGKKIEGDIIFATTSKDEGKLIFITKKGFIKIVDKKEFVSSRTIINSTKLNKDDKILKIAEINDEDSIIVTTDKNYLNFKIEEISELKKTSAGVASIKIANTEEIKDMVLYNKEITEKITLNGKEYELNSLKQQKRGSKGTKF